MVTPSAVLARREAVSAAGGFDPHFSITADWDMWIRLGQQGPVGVSRALTVGYTVHDTSMRTDVDRLLRERDTLEQKHRELLRRHRMGLGDELFWQWIAAGRAPAAQRRLAARWYVRHQRRYARPWRVASGPRPPCACPAAGRRRAAAHERGAFAPVAQPGRLAGDRSRRAVTATTDAR